MKRRGGPGCGSRLSRGARGRRRGGHHGPAGRGDGGGGGHPGLAGRDAGRGGGRWRRRSPRARLVCRSGRRQGRPERHRPPPTPTLRCGGSRPAAAAPSPSSRLLAARDRIAAGITKTAAPAPVVRKWRPFGAIECYLTFHAPCSRRRQASGPRIRSAWPPRPPRGFAGAPILAAARPRPAPSRPFAPAVPRLCRALERLRAVGVAVAFAQPAPGRLEGFLV
jgi:hypothetical protein